MLITELDFELPQGLIATRPAEPRDSCRLLVVSRSDTSALEHRRFSDLPEYLRKDDLLVFNTSAVLPAKIQGVRADSGGAIEGLFVARTGAGMWRVMLKSNSRLKVGQMIALHNAAGGETGFALRLEVREDAFWLVRPIDTATGQVATQGERELLGRVGATPLPPYIRKARKGVEDNTPDELDRAWYQTVYADPSAVGAGSVAAPTAGLHFTPELLGKIERMGVQRADVRLHVGLGTFKPVETERVEQHPIHSESVDVPSATIAAMESTRRTGGRIVAVGTTSVRAIESLPPASDWTDPLRENGHQGDTGLFILPGRPFRHTQAMITNFHLPRSTLLALVAAMMPGGAPELLEIYGAAIREGYRFYSYGDAMLILP